MADIAPEPNFQRTTPDVAIAGILFSLATVAGGLFISKKMKQRSMKRAAQAMESKEPALP
jgi:hypothetical protein